MDWAGLNAALGHYLEEEQPSDAFTAILPVLVQKAELRIYREIDFLAHRGVNASLVFVPGSRTLDLTGMTGQLVNGITPLNPFPVSVEGISAVLPAWQQPSAGTRVRFRRVSLDTIDMVWPQETVTGSPGSPFALWTMLDDHTAIVAPTPDNQYLAEVTGTWRPAPMSSVNTRTWLGDNLPDLLIDACMIEAMGYRQDFGAQSDDPRAALSWEQRYQADKASATSEEGRRRLGGLVPPIAMAAPPGRAG